MKTILLFYVMVFFHIVDDYYLQGLLSKLKQKSWWQENYPYRIYKDDYKMALFMHGFSWAVMVHIPVVVMILMLGMNFTNAICLYFAISIIVHCGVHCYVDDLKANKYKINLIQDQMCHLIQLLIMIISFKFII